MRRPLSYLLPCALAIGAAMSVSACSGGNDGDYCEVLLADTATAAYVFNPVATSLGNVDEMQTRLDLLEQIQDPPDDLSVQLGTWVDYVTELRDTWERDPTDWDVAIPIPEDTEQARDELFQAYLDRCMR